MTETPNAGAPADAPADELATAELAAEETAQDETAQDEPVLTAEEAAQAALDARIQALVKELEDEYGAENVTELLVEAAFNDDVADLLVEAEGAIQEAIRTAGKKVGFYIHTEPSAAGVPQLYLLRSLKPTEWNSGWLRILSGAPEEFAKHHASVLDLAMVYPSFGGTDWDWTGEGLRSPRGMAKERLVSAVFDQEVSQQTPEPIEFTADHLGDAQKAARTNREKRAKPGF